MNGRDRFARLGSRFSAVPPAAAQEGDCLLHPAEYERGFGYQIMPLDMTAAEAVRHYLGTIRPRFGSVPDAALSPRIAASEAAERYREILG